MIADPVRFSVLHRTVYRYSAEVTSSQSIVHLIPRSTPTQRVLEASVVSTPAEAERHEFIDAFGNTALYLAVERPHAEWVVEARSTVELLPSDPDRRRPADVAWEDAVEAVRAGTLGEEAVAMAMPSTDVPVDPALAGFAAASFPPGAGLVEALGSLTRRIFEQFAFDTAATEVSTPVLTVLEQRRGVCQDFAHLAIGALRSLGLAARYVSGYLETDPPPGRSRLVGADASHAWVSVCVPGIGWVDADPTNGYLAEDRHITVAWGRDYTDVAPARGVVFGPPSSQCLDVAVDVVRVPRT